MLDQEKTTGNRYFVYVFARHLWHYRHFFFRKKKKHWTHMRTLAFVRSFGSLTSAVCLSALHTYIIFWPILYCLYIYIYIVRKRGKKTSMPGICTLSEIYNLFFIRVIVLFWHGVRKISRSVIASKWDDFLFSKRKKRRSDYLQHFHIFICTDNDERWKK